ncbi:MAG: cellulase family glycosylhydrolase [Chthoniobacteraceae bacterium]
MKFPAFHSRISLPWLAAHLLVCLAVTPLAALEQVRLSSDGKSFVLAKSGRPFRVWGVNYDHDSRSPNTRLLEDYWIDEWDSVRSDFQEMKDLGANVVRIHLQVGKFMSAPDAPNEAALAQLRRLLELAEQTGLYLDITGLGCYHRADTPAWYDAMDEAERWDVQARFWSAIAKECRDSHAVFCYDLMNEPVIDGKKDEGWVGGELGGKCFVQRLTLDPAGRPTGEIVKAWIEKLTAAIRAEDHEHLITVGVIPWAHVWPNAKPVFYAPEVSGNLDFVSIHLYPKKGEVDRALTAMWAYEIGKPLVIEETFPLACSLEEMDDFLKRAKSATAGYMSFYWGKTIAEYDAATENTLTSEIVGGWLKYFQQEAESMKQP